MVGTGIMSRTIVANCRIVAWVDHMISRKTAHIIGEVYAALFREPRTGHRVGGYPSSYTYYVVGVQKLYDFLYDNGYPAWFCNKARAITISHDTRPLKDFIMKLHTGETQYDATPDWSWEQRTQLGQKQLVDLARDILNYCHSDSASQRKQETSHGIETLTRALELDGYAYQNSRLLASEEEVLDTEEEAGILEKLFTSLGLGNKETAFHHLNLSEEHYMAQRWDDSISNSRKFLECVLQEVAAAHSLSRRNTRLLETVYSQPVQVRDYLEKEGLIETKEKKAIAEVYGLLSHTGSHPYMAQNDQARLLRHLALTLSQFVMLRLQGSLASA